MLRPNHSLPASDCRRGTDLRQMLPPFDKKRSSGFPARPLHCADNWSHAKPRKEKQSGQVSVRFSVFSVLSGETRTGVRGCVFCCIAAGGGSHAAQVKVFPSAVSPLTPTFLQQNRANHRPFSVSFPVEMLEFPSLESPGWQSTLHFTFHDSPASISGREKHYPVV